MRHFKDRIQDENRRARPLYVPFRKGTDRIII